MNNNSQNGKPIFGEYTTFDRAFPDIKTIRVLLKETGRNTNPLSTSIFEKSNFRENIACSNGACISGGFHLGNIVREMIDKKETKLEVSDKKCEGVEKHSKICWNFFSYNIEIEYK